MSVSAFTRAAATLQSCLNLADISSVRRTLLRISCVVAVLAAAAVAASPAAAAFRPAVDLSAPGYQADRPQVAVDAQGDAVFVWNRFDGANDRIQTRALSATGVLSPVQTLSPAGQDATEPQVAVDADGDAVFAWRRFDGAYSRIQARTRSAAGILSPVQNISYPGADAFVPRVDVAPDGDAVFAWNLGPQNQTRARSAAGVLSPVQDLTTSPVLVSASEIAVDDDGDAVYAWRESDGGSYTLIQAQTRSAAGVLGPAHAVSPATHLQYRVHVAVDAGGDAVFTWEGSDGSDIRVWARAMSAGGLLSPAVQGISPAGRTGADPQLGVDAEGDAVFAWYGPGPEGTFRIQSRLRQADGSLSSITMVTPPRYHATHPQVGVDADGNAVFAWQFSGSVKRIQTRNRPAEGALSPIETLSADTHSFEPELAVGTGGGAALAWNYPYGGNYPYGTKNRIQGSIGP
jgi:hypothetical protein